MTQDINRLKQRWIKKTGDEMPPEIQDLEIGVIHRAVIRVERGETVFVPKKPLTAESVGSMAEWDKQDRMW